MDDGFGPRAPRRTRLRDATNKIHESIDQHVSHEGFLTSSSGYNAYLIATLQARRAVEKQLGASGVAELYPEWDARKITALLETDLADLQIADLDHGGDDPSPALSRGGVWGALYVLEGSALGARVLQRRVALLEMTAQFGARHLALQTSDSSAWARFLALLEGVQLNDREEGDCLSAALATFARFGRTYGLPA